MIFRRFRKHVAEHDWFAVAIDVAIVVVGVFLGTQANNWNEARLDAQRGQDYRTRLIAELVVTERGMRASAAYYQDVRRHALAALQALDRPATALGTPFLVDAYQATQIFPRTPKHVTWDEILSSGNAELLGSSDLRERIGNFYWRMDGLMSLYAEPPLYRDRMRSVLPYPVQAAIRARCDARAIDYGNGLVFAELPERCALALDPVAARSAVAQVRAMPDLRHNLNRLLVELDSKVQRFGNLAEGARDLRARVAADAER